MVFDQVKVAIGLLCVVAAGLCGCSPRALHEAEEVVAQADSLWHNGQMYGIDEGDSATLAQACETLKKQSAVSRQLSEVFPFVPCTSSLCTYAHACYHYGRLLRAKDDPVAAMQVFIDATHSRTRDYHILGRVYSNMGSICHLANEFTLSYDMYQRSADCFLKNGDTIAYYFLLNDMAFEKGMSKDLDNCRSIVHLVKKAELYNEHLTASCNRTLAEAFLIAHQYDSALYFAYEALRSSQQQEQEPASLLILAQAYSYIGKNDSAVHYSQQVLNSSHALGDINNALYILTNDDKTKDLEAVRQTAADRSDTQKLLEIRQGKMSQAVQLLEQDLTREPDWKWLYAVIVTLLIIGCSLGFYVYKRHKRRQLLSQQINDYQQKRLEDLEICCTALRNSKNLKTELDWTHYDSMCTIVNSRLCGIAERLQAYSEITPNDIRLCVLVLLELPYDEIANILNLSPKSIAKLKSLTAHKLGTTMKNLRVTLVEIACKDNPN